MMLSTELQEFLWHNREEPFYEVHPNKKRTRPIPKDRALHRLRQGDKFFGVVPRITPGSKKADCPATFDALWCDIDDASRDPEQIVADVLDVLEPLSFAPSAMVYSGSQGIHCYWKLDADIPIEQVERTNRHFMKLVRADSTFDRTRVLRHPGTRNEKNNGLVRLLSFSAEIHSVATITRLGVPEPVPKRSRRSAHQDREWREAAEALEWWPRPWEDIPIWHLPDAHKTFMTMQPRKGAKRPNGKPIDRSAIEQSIIYWLVGWGASDEQMRAFADENFPKHRENLDGSYLADSINSARQHHYEKGRVNSPLGGTPKKRDAKHRHGTRAELCALLPRWDGLTPTEARKVTKSTGRSPSTAKRWFDLAVEQRWITVRDGRVQVDPKWTSDPETSTSS